MDADLVDRIGAVLGRRVTAWRQALGGYTAAERWICALEDGQSAFASGSRHANRAVAPDQLTGPDDAPFAVITAGHFAARAGLPPSSPTSRARISQLMQLKPSLPWACRLVGLDPPDLVAP